jgi:phospholipase C
VQRSRTSLLLPSGDGSATLAVLVAGGACLLSLASACTGSSSTGGAPPVTSRPDPPSTSPSSEPSQLGLARTHIKHVVFLIKENRSFDTLFGRVPGADGPPDRVPALGEDGTVRMIRPASILPLRDRSSSG